MASIYSLLTLFLTILMTSTFGIAEDRNFENALSDPSSENRLLSRRRRFVDFPAGAGIEVKWSVNFPFQSYTSYKAKVQFALPIFIKFPHDKIVKTKRSINEPIGDHEDMRRVKREARQERISLYQTIETILTEIGVPGHDCLLRTICEVAEIPFEQGILGDLINTLLTVTGNRHTEDEINEIDYEPYNKYVNAEEHGHFEGNCHMRYSNCSESPIDMIPYLENVISGLL